MNLPLEGGTSSLQLEVLVAGRAWWHPPSLLATCSSTDSSLKAPSHLLRELGAKVPLGIERELRVENRPLLPKPLFQRPRHSPIILQSANIRVGDEWTAIIPSMLQQLQV